MMKELGFAEAVDSAEVRFDIEGSSQVACPVTGVAEDEIDMGDYTIRVLKFTMTRFGMEVLIRVYTDEKKVLLVGRKFDIQTEDGTSLIDHSFHPAFLWYDGERGKRLCGKKRGARTLRSCIILEVRRRRRLPKSEPIRKRAMPGFRRRWGWN